MKIALVTPPIFDPAYKKPYDLTPLGLLRIAPWLESQGHEVSLFQFDPQHRISTSFRLPENEVSWLIADIQILFEDGALIYPVFYRGIRPQKILERLAGFNPDEIWITTGLTNHFQGIHLMTTLIEKYLKKPVRLGGILATLAPERLKFMNVKEIYAGPLLEVEKFDYDYRYLEHKPGIINLKLHRGCVNPSACIWCAVKVLEPKMEVSNLERIFRWIEDMAKTGNKYFRLWSSNLFVSKKYRDRFLDGLQKIHNDYGCGFEASEGVEPWLFDSETALKMARSGFQKLSIPLESLSDSLRKEWGKPGSVDRCLEGIAAGNESGMRVSVFCMAGVPGQKLEDVLASIDFCKKANSKPRIHAYSPIPRTELWERSEKNWKNKHLLLTNGYYWPEVRTTTEAVQLEELFTDNLDSEFGPFRGGLDLPKVPVEEKHFFQDLFWLDLSAVYL